MCVSKCRGGVWRGVLSKHGVYGCGPESVYSCLISIIKNENIGNGVKGYISPGSFLFTSQFHYYAQLCAPLRTSLGAPLSI